MTPKAFVFPCSDDCAMVTHPSRIKTIKTIKLSSPQYIWERDRSRQPEKCVEGSVLAQPPAPGTGIEGLWMPVPPMSSQREKSAGEESNIGNQLKMDSGRGRGARDGGSSVP